MKGDALVEELFLMYSNNTILFNTAQYSTLQYSAVQNNRLEYNHSLNQTVLYITIYLL